MFIHFISLQFLPLRPAEAGVCGRELAPFPSTAVLHIRHRLNRNELRIRADEDKLAATRPPATGGALFVGDGNLVHDCLCGRIRY